METLIEECSPADWEVQTRPIFSEKGLESTYAQANIFHCMQFAYDEIKNHRNDKAYAIKVKQSDGSFRAVGWLTSYFISPQTLRIRGLYIVPAFQRLGLMTLLISHVKNENKNKVQKIISFSYSASIPWHLKNGFKIETSFKPRKYQYFDESQKKYVNSREIFTLLSFNFL